MRQRRVRPEGWRCDGEDCSDGSDERQCVAPVQLFDGVPHCPDGSDKGLDACGEPRLRSLRLGWRAS